MTSKIYYNLSNSISKYAAKIASESKYTTPKDTFTIHNYYYDADTNANTKANYEYITPKTSKNYCGGWAYHYYYAIAEDKFYYKNSSSSAYTSFKFVHKLSAPLLKNVVRDTNWGRCQAPFEYYAMGANYAGYVAKIRWNNSNNRIQVAVFDDVGNELTTESRQGYGVFILLSGAGGGGGGGDNEYWGQGKPGGGGGGGGGTALIYFDAKKAYEYDPGNYLYISIGTGGAGGKGGNGFSAGSAGGASTAELKNSNGATMYSITCGGGKGGAGHSWDAAADSAGGAGGGVWVSDDDTYSTILDLLDSAAGGGGGAGKRGSDGNSGATVRNDTWNIPFTDSWGKRDVFSYGSESCRMGVGGAHNWQGGGGGGCCAGYQSSTNLVALCGQGVGGYGGGSGQAGANGANGFCGIFYNYIPGVTAGCSAKKY